MISDSNSASTAESHVADIDSCFHVSECRAWGPPIYATSNGLGGEIVTARGIIVDHGTDMEVCCSWAEGLWAGTRF